MNYHLDIDGIFGVKTEAAVLDYQKKQQLVTDGMVGINTLENLYISNGFDKGVAYVNSRDFYSRTDYFIYTHVEEYLVYLFKGYHKSWELIKKYETAIGKPLTPTLKGFFTVKAKGPGYSKVKEGFKVKWYTQYYENYLFHSILFNLDGTVFDGRLGLPISEGCLRLKEEDAKYIYDYIPYGSLVVIR